MSFVSHFDFSDAKWTWEKFRPNFKKFMDYVITLENKVDGLEKKVERMEKQIGTRKAAFYPGISVEKLVESNINGLQEMDNELGDVKKQIGKRKPGFYPADDLEQLVENIEAKVENRVYRPVTVSLPVEPKSGGIEGKKESWAHVVRRKQVVVRGTKTVSSEEPAGSLLSTLRLGHQPHADFCARGIPRLKDTKFRNIDEYNTALKAGLEKEGMKVRFVSVFEPPKDDRRGTTFARIGSFKDHSDVILSGNLWPTNVFVRKWVF